MKTFLIFATVAVGLVIAADWNYDSPATWGELYPECYGEQQSPIDIDTKYVTENHNLEYFSFHGYDSQYPDLTLSNSGYSANIAVNTPNIHITGGSLPGDKFMLAQFHFHWGRHDMEGSEHLMNGMAYPAEVHFVHYNAKYGDLATAIHESDGLAVLGIMLQSDDWDNEAYAPIFQTMEDVMHKGSDAQIPMDTSLISLFPDHRETYYRYSGSLTTPACQESVTWTVFKEPVSLGKYQIESLRRLMDHKEGGNGSNIMLNFRPPQDLYGRDVWVSTLKPEPPTASATLPVINLSLTFGLLALLALWH